MVRVLGSTSAGFAAFSPRHALLASFSDVFVGHLDHDGWATTTKTDNSRSFRHGRAQHADGDVESCRVRVVLSKFDDANANVVEGIDDER